MTPWGFYTQHEPHQITVEDYMASRYVMEPLRLLDRDRPVNSCAAFVFTTSDRATDMRQPPVFVLNHAQSTPQARSTIGTLDEHQEWCRSLARNMWEGSGLGPDDVDIFNLMTAI